MGRRTAVSWMAVVLMVGITAGAPGEVVTVELGELETIYGGIIGKSFRQADYDLGFEFDSVASAALQLTGVTDVPGSALTFTAFLNGVAAPPVGQISDGTFEVTVPLIVGLGGLAGSGTVGLNLETAGCCDLSSSVITAELVIDGTVLCPGDTNGDQAVDVGDLVNVISQWGTSGEAGGDVTGDGLVDVLDVIAVVNGWGACGPAGLGRCCFAGIIAPPPYICDVTTEVQCAALVDSFWEQGLTCEDPCDDSKLLGRCCHVGIVFPPYLCDTTTELQCQFFVGGIWTADLTCGDGCGDDPGSPPLIRSRRPRPARRRTGPR